jgi:aspartyl protease family protein
MRTASRTWPALVLLSMTLGHTGHALAVESLYAVALFPGKAVLEVDGVRHTLAVGEASPEGVELISADSDRAVVRVGGVERELPLGGRIGGQFSSSEAPSVYVYRDRAGMFTTVGSINGQPVRFMVDTGASAVAISEVEARRLGIQYRLRGEEIRVRTASGIAPAHAVMLDRVKVGGIELRNVQGVVVEGEQPAVALLGMSFLSRLTTRNEGDAMVLERRF